MLLCVHAHWEPSEEKRDDLGWPVQCCEQSKWIFLSVGQALMILKNICICQFPHVKKEKGET